jgi:hypothetical protein
MCGFVYVWVLLYEGVCVRMYMGFVMCRCFYNCVDVLVICILVFTVFFVLFLLCIFILSCY